MELLHTIPGPLWMLSRLTTVLILLAFVSAAEVSAQATPTAEPTGIYLTPEEIAAFAAEFSDNPLIGGQVAPRLSKWVTDDVFLFLQFDNADPAQATQLLDIGIGVKGVFCAEDQPDRSFTHFHRYDAPDYASGHGGDPGAEGYWLTWAAVDTFAARDGRRVTPGIDYEFSPTPPPSCGADVPEPTFTPEGAHRLNPDEVATLAALFADPTLTGGQIPPRLGKWVNADNFIFVQLDDLEAPTAVRYFGVGSVGKFCAETQPSTDFTHYHRFHAPEYREGHAGEQLHTFTVPKLGIDTGPLQPAATENLIFTAPAERGTYEVLCTFPGHEEAGMIGSLVVA